MDDELDMCCLCRFSWPVQLLHPERVSPAPDWWLFQGQSSRHWRGTDNLVGSVPGHREMGGDIYPSGPGKQQ